MFQISEIRVENLNCGCVTDSTAPVISFSLSDEKENVFLKEATVKIGTWEKKVNRQLGIVYDGELCPFSEYVVEIETISNYGDIATAKTSFRAGRLSLPWKAKWISDKNYLPKKKQSPVPMTFRKKVSFQKEIAKAYVTSTAIGIYDLEINGRQVTKEYFTPGFTSYPHTLQYNYYDVTEFIAEKTDITAVVGGGWAVGRFTYESKSQITAKRQSFLLELFVEYTDGTTECIITDDSWEVTLEGNYRFGDFYDGEIYDATIDTDAVLWKKADEVNIGITPKLLLQYGCPVTRHEILNPVAVFVDSNGERIYDFGQNFAGVVCLEIDGFAGQEITVRHAEVLHENQLFTKTLRTAKATLCYRCKGGHQVYSPKLTYMGFRYIGIRGIEEEHVKVSAYALYSDIEEIGSFSCSNPLLNQLQSNITWSGKSNFVDIPTDCPQRDERQGWTGDISIFASTACYNFNLSRFLDKWLLDVRNEQSAGGGIPFVIPKHGNFGPSVPTACWGDSCILVPWAEYMSGGNIVLLRKQYPTMKKYLQSVKRWAGLSGFGKRKYIWKWLFQFGDWCAPEGYVTDWMKRGKWIATAYYAHSCNIMAQIADVLHIEEDKTYYDKLYRNISEAYQVIFTDGNGKLKEEFQTGYVLPIAFSMIEEEIKHKMAEHLIHLLQENDWHLSTGFPATSFLLFALCDSGKVEEAYKLLLQDTCPSWLYEVKCGATTFWERWDAMRPDGSVNIGKLNENDKDSDAGMCSFNHYAYGAVGDFLYRRVAGIEATKGGYETFQIRPHLGGDLSYVKSTHETPFGWISSEWEIKDGEFTLRFTVPVSTQCTVVLPSGKTFVCGSGNYTMSEVLEQRTDNEKSIDE